MFSGILLIDKPAGWTSHDIVAKLRGVTGVRQIGHAGTLDPAATGLMVLLFGSATKIQASFQKFEKTYEAIITLGARSATDDGEGPIMQTPNAKPPSRDAVERTLESFRGTITQRPPDISAKQVKGQRAYRAARKGKPLTLEPVTVTIHNLDLLEYDYPNVRLRIRCSSGTYIRAIARDLGERLGIGGYLAELRRTTIGTFQVRFATPIDEVSENNWRLLLQDHRRTLSEHQRRAVGVIIRDGHILVFYRFVRNREYFVFPGGGVRPTETPEEAVRREVKEETDLDARSPHLLGTIDNEGREESYFLIREFSGTPTVGKDVADRMHEQNRSELRWIPIDQLSDLTTLYPTEARRLVPEWLKKNPD